MQFLIPNETLAFESRNVTRASLQEDQRREHNVNTTARSFIKVPRRDLFVYGVFALL